MKWVYKYKTRLVFFNILFYYLQTLLRILNFHSRNYLKNLWKTQKFQTQSFRRYFQISWNYVYLNNHSKNNHLKNHSTVHKLYFILCFKWNEYLNIKTALFLIYILFYYLKTLRRISNIHSSNYLKNPWQRQKLKKIIVILKKLLNQLQLCLFKKLKQYRKLLILCDIYS